MRNSVYYYYKDNTYLTQERSIYMATNEPKKSKQSPTIHFRLSEQLKEECENNAKKRGCSSTGEYLKYLIRKDSEVLKNEK